MTTAIQARPALDVPALWNGAGIQLVKDMVAEKATPAEFLLLIHLANKWRLDPLAKQIYCVKYGNKPAQIFAGLAGFVEIANRDGQLDAVLPKVRRVEESIDIPYTAWENGVQVAKRLQRPYQWVGRATVYKKGSDHPTVVEVWEEEYSSGRDLWASKPRTMIQKVAMCQALRLAFSISGLYDRDEMGGDAPPDATPTPTPRLLDGETDGVYRTDPDPPAPTPPSLLLTAPQRAEIKALCGALGWTRADDTRDLLTRYQVARFGDLNAHEADRVIAELREQAALVQAVAP